MKYSGNTVSNRCAEESVAVITIRRGAASRSRKGKLPDVVLTTTTRPGTGRSRADQSADSRSGPTRLNFASMPSNVPWPISTTISRSSRVMRSRIEASVRRTFSAWPDGVAAASGCRVSDNTVTRAGSKRSTSDERLRQIRRPSGVLRDVFLPARRPRHDQRVAILGAVCGHALRHAVASQTASTSSGQSKMALATTVGTAWSG